MNLYMIVEGDRTELQVYPEWLKILSPHIQRVSNPREAVNDNYYLFSGGGIPSIYNHIANAAEDIVNMDKEGVHYDYLLVCLDTEGEEVSTVESEVYAKLEEHGIELKNTELVVCVQKVCMESWFLGNRKFFKNNPQDPQLLRYIDFYNVYISNPEDMTSLDEEMTYAQFHYEYLRLMFRERNITYSKRNPGDVMTKSYLEQLVKRTEQTNDLRTFKKWYDFVQKYINKQ